MNSTNPNTSSLERREALTPQVEDVNFINKDRLNEIANRKFEEWRMLIAHLPDEKKKM